ncbi:MAG: RNA polymerase sigma factor [Candidatus Poribacteria bacterium]|nr:RNA polymerase sigma factor [Candidatus Poribacteria bacterium]
MTDEQRRDARLVHRILSGDETALAELNALYKHRICEFIASKIGDWHYAEELTQDTFLKVKQHLQTLREPEKVLNWMFRIADQLVAGWHRKNQKRIQMESFAEVSGTDMESAAANAYQLAETDALNEGRYINLFAAIAQLPELEQKIFRLQLQNKSYEEIAEICEVSMSSVRNRLSRAKQKLKAWAAAWEEANAEGRDLDFSEFNKGKGK